MKHAISAVLLAMFLAAGCAQTRMTRFEYGDIRLDVGGRITKGRSVAMVDYQPGIYYAIDQVPKQVFIEVKLVEVGRKDQEILGVNWFSGAGGPLIAASNIKNTTPQMSPPMAMGGLVNVGVGGIGGGGGAKCPHGGTHGTCAECKSGGGGTGINLPVVVGSEGKDSDKVTSVSATFDLGEAVNINESYLAIDIKVGVAPDGKIIIQTDIPNHETLDLAVNGRVGSAEEDTPKEARPESASPEKPNKQDG